MLPAYATVVRAFIIRLLHQAGITSVSRSALDVLVDLYSQHLTLVATNCQQHAALARRTQSNLDDLSFAMHGLSIHPKKLTDLAKSWDWNLLKVQLLHDFGGDQQENHSISSPYSEKPILDFAHHPFYKETLKRKAREEETQEEMAIDDSENELALFLSTSELPPSFPSFFPPFPSPHTYKRTTISEQENEDPISLRQSAVEQTRMVQDNLKKLLTATEANVFTVPLVNYDLNQDVISK